MKYLQQCLDAHQMILRANIKNVFDNYNNSTTWMIPISPSIVEELEKVGLTVDDLFEHMDSIE